MNDSRSAEPSFDLRAMVQPADAASRVPFEVDQRLNPGLLNEEAGSPVPSERMGTRQTLHATTPPVATETHAAYVDFGTPIDIQVGVDDSRIDVVIAGDQWERGNLIVKSPLAPLLKRGVGGISVAALPRNDGGEGDFLTNDLHVTGQPAGPCRGAQEVVSNDQADIRFNADHRANLAPFGPAARASYARVAQGTGVTGVPAADLQDLAHVADPAAAIPAKSQPLLQSEAADATTASGRPVLFENNAAMHLKRDISQEGEIPNVAPEPISPSLSPQPSAVRASAEPSVTVQQSLLVTQGSGGTTPAADIEAPVHFPSPRVPSGCGEGVGEGGFLTGDLHVTLSASSLTTSAGEAQDSISYSGRAQLTEQVADPLQLTVSVEGQAEALVASSPMISDRSRLTQRSIVPIGKSSDQSELIGSGISESESVLEHIQVERMDGDRDAMGHGRPNLESAQDIRQDRSTSGSEDGDRLSERSSPPPGDGRQFGSDLASAAAPRGECLPPDMSAPSIRPRVIVEQVAEQIATAAGISRRQEGESVQLRLHPQALGEVVIEVSWKDSGIIAAIRARSPVTGELLTADLGRLRIALEEHGIPVSDLGVQVGLDFRQWSYTRNGSHASPAIGYAAGTIPWHDRRSVLSVASAIGPDSVIDITV